MPAHRKPRDKWGLTDTERRYAVGRAKGMGQGEAYAAAMGKTQTKGCQATGWQVEQRPHVQAHIDR